VEVSQSLSFGYSSALSSVTARKDDMDQHNSTPMITCEGICSRKLHTLWQEHTLVSEIYDQEKYRFEQVYHCNRCNTPRRFGLTEVRVTGIGSKN